MTRIQLLREQFGLCFYSFCKKYRRVITILNNSVLHFIGLPIFSSNLQSKKWWIRSKCLEHLLEMDTPVGSFRSLENFSPDQRLFHIIYFIWYSKPNIRAIVLLLLYLFLERYSIRGKSFLQCNEISIFAVFMEQKIRCLLET